MQLSLELSTQCIACEKRGRNLVIIVKLGFYDHCLMDGFNLKSTAASIIMDVFYCNLTDSDITDYNQSLVKTKHPSLNIS